MKVLCPICKKTVADIPLEEVLLFCQWLEMEGGIPACFECAKRVVANVYVQAYAELRAAGNLFVFSCAPAPPTAEPSQDKPTTPLY